MNWYFEVLKKYAVFNGRARRKEYWYFIWFNLIITFISIIIYKMNIDIDFLNSIYSVILLTPNIAVTVRRLHDTDRTGWWILIIVIPAIAWAIFSLVAPYYLMLDSFYLAMMIFLIILIISWMILTIFTVQDSSPGENRYGPNPKEKTGLNSDNNLAVIWRNYFEVLKKKYAVFNGRARQEEYWYFILFNLIVGFILVIIDGRIAPEANIGFLTLYSLVIFIPGLAVSIRRLHDTDRTGWWILINLIPILGWIIFIIFTAQDSSPGKNRYGNYKDYL